MRLKLRREVKSPEVDLGVASIEMVGLPGGSDGKESACSAGDTGDLGSMLGSGKSPEGNGYPLQYSCLENPTDRGDWWATVDGAV